MESRIELSNKKKTLLILESVQKKIKYVLMKVFFINIAIISLKF